jgi:hypothetical protein
VAIAAGALSECKAAKFLSLTFFVKLTVTDVLWRHQTNGGLRSGEPKMKVSRCLLGSCWCGY